MIYDINIKKLDDKAIIPTYGSEYAAGADLYACLDSAVDIEPGQTVLIHTGIAMEIPAGYAGLVYARSGLASKKGLAPANKVGVIDADYKRRDHGGSSQSWYTGTARGAGREDCPACDRSIYSRGISSGG